jgi:hypothetical protein
MIRPRFPGWLPVLLAASILLASCGTSAPPQPAPATETAVLAPENTPVAPVETPPPTPTPTPPPPEERIILYAPGGVAQFEPALQELAHQAGLKLENRAELAIKDIDPGVRLVVAEASPGLMELVTGAPGTPFLALGDAGLSPAANLSVLAGGGSREDTLAFTAGYTAVVITPDWRVGMIGVADRESSNLRRQGFLSGGVFFCGLCRQVYPPYYDSQGAYIRFPLYTEVSQGAGAGEWQSAVDWLLERSVKTVYLPEAPDDPGVLESLGQSGLLVIAGFPPPPSLRPSWVVTLRSRPELALAEAVPALLSGEGSFTRSLSIQLEEPNPENFSPGKQALVEKMVEDLLSGFIATGTD